jgi:hypothetical protein
MSLLHPLAVIGAIGFDLLVGLTFFGLLIVAAFMLMAAIFDVRNSGLDLSACLAVSLLCLALAFGVGVLKSWVERPVSVACARATP